MVSRNEIPKYIRDFADGVTQEFSKEMSKTGRQIYYDSLVSTLLALGVSRRSLSRSKSRQIVSYVTQGVARRRQQIARRRTKKGWPAYEERTLDYLARIPSFQHFGDHIIEGTANIGLLIEALNYLYSKGRTKESVEMKYFRIKQYKPRRKKRVAAAKRQAILARKIHNEKLEDRLLRYLPRYSEFQNQYGAPNIARLTEAVNYIFYDNRNVRTQQNVRDFLST